MFIINKIKYFLILYEENDMEYLIYNLKSIAKKEFIVDKTNENMDERVSLVFKRWDDTRF